VSGRVKNIETGTRFTKLEVLKFVGVIDSHAVWLCKCDCGKIVERDGSQMRYGHQKSCGCWGAKRRPFESRYNELVYHARLRQIPCSLTYEEYLSFVDTKTCHYCENLIQWSPYRVGNTVRHNLDRIDNFAGYSLDNCLVCCYDCNVTRGNRFTYDEFIQLAPVLRSIQIVRSRNEKTR
jgi:hypothetical protein